MIYNIIILTHIVRFLGGYHMITAREARAKSESNYSRKEMEEAEKKINEAIAEGRNSCFLGNGISNSTKENLKNLGYKVEFRYWNNTEVRW